MNIEQGIEENEFDQGKSNTEVAPDNEFDTGLNRFTILLEEIGLIGDLYFDCRNFREINEFDQ